MDYTKVADRTASNGEPNYIWIDNIQDYSRMGDAADFRDASAEGCNPCFAGDTLIAVADGRGAVPINELAESGSDVPVYAVDPESGKVDIQWGRHPRLTRSNAELLTIIFNDDSTLRVTPDHKMLLRSGQTVEAKDLKVGDSLPALTKRLEPVSQGGKKYLRVNCDTRDTRREHYFEHRLIAKFHDPKTWEALHQSGGRNGYVTTGDLVVHHKDGDPINNAPSNLQIMSFGEHVQLHAASNAQGSNNPMYGKTHSEETRAKIGQKTRERCADPEYMARFVESHQNPPAECVQAFTARRNAAQKEYWLEQERQTDLATRWVDGKLRVVKQCDACEIEMLLPWSKRSQTSCNRSCGNKHLEAIKNRKEAAQATFTSRQKETRTRQIEAYLQLEQTLGVGCVMKKEWEAYCRREKIPVRFQPADPKNPYILTGFKHLRECAREFNHRVKAVIRSGICEPVYSLTVDLHHTVGVVTRRSNNGECFGVFTRQCAEQTLESMELCNLVETFPARHDTSADFRRTLKFAYLYAKTVTLVPTHNLRTNAVVMRNRRIGTSQSGIVQAFARHGRRTMFEWCKEGYTYINELDRIYARWLCVPESIKKTSVKPSGTISLLPGATPGIHYPEAEYYWRVIRFASDSPMVQALSGAGYRCVDLAPKEPNTTAVYFAVQEAFFTRSKHDVSMWEQLENAAQYQALWADNQVSATITFTPEEGRHLARALELYETRLKGISFLPLRDHGYAHAPYQAITEAEYLAYVGGLSPVDWSSAEKAGVIEPERFCDGGTCTVSVP